MFSTFSTLLVAALALTADAAPNNNNLFARQGRCPGNNCVRQITGTGAAGVRRYPPASRSADCSSFLLTTVSACGLTATTTADPVTTTSTVTITEGSITVFAQTLVATETASEFTTTTVTTSLALAKMKRAVPAQGTVSQEPAACQPQTTSNPAIPASANSCTASVSYSQACSCYLSGLSSRTTTTAGGAEATLTSTSTSVSLIYVTTTIVSTTTSATTTTTTASTTVIATATATTQARSGRFFITIQNDMSTVRVGAGNALVADMTNNAAYFIINEQGLLKDAGDLFFAETDGTTSSVITLVEASSPVNGISCTCANYTARSGQLSCRSSTGGTVLQLCGANPRALTISTIGSPECENVIASCSAI